MLEKNKALIRRWLDDVLSRGNLEWADELFARNYNLHDPSFPHDVHGLEGVKRYVTAYRAAFSNVRFAVEDQVSEGDTVVTSGALRETQHGEFVGIAPTGEEVTVSGIEFDRVLSGRIDEAWVGYHPFAGPALDPERIKDGIIAVMGEAFPDLRIAEADSVREGDKVAFCWVISGTHEGEFLGVAPTDAQIEAMGMDTVRVAD
ncbi:MAG: ester cyclase [Actinobacteria bacterium]|nr:ester cyclase [Actinomycetota bacterium]